MKCLFPILLVFLACKPSSTVITSSSTKTLAIEKNLTKEITESDTPNPSGQANDSAGFLEDIEYKVGNRQIILSKYSKGTGPTFVNVHDDENTSVTAALAVIDSLGGILLQLKHTGNRNVKFQLNNKDYEFDPNRMFTDLGVDKSLDFFGNNSLEAHNEVRKFAEQIVREIKSDIIFTLHNNSENRYSVKSYLEEYRSEAADVFINPKADPDDFYFVTERLFFDALKMRGYNVVLQNNQTATDDGSLSVLASWRKIPYINIEAQHGHLTQQIEMLLTVYELFE